jgi:general secretion pathway protein N
MARAQPLSPARTPWPWALSGAAVGLVLATLIFAPARWLANQVDAATSGQVRLTDAHGTLWNGSSQLTLSGGPGSSDRSTLPGRLSWRLQPGWGQAKVFVFADCCMQAPLALELLPRWGGAQLKVGDQRSQWPALLLTGLGTPWNTIRAEGQLVLTSQSFGAQWVHGRLTLQGQLQLDAIDMASRMSTLRPMGSYRFVLQGGDTPRLNLSTTQGSLQLSGSGQWTDGRLRFQGEASAAPDRKDALTNLLNIIGRREGARSIINVG